MFSASLQSIKYFTDNFALTQPSITRIEINNYGDDSTMGAAARAFLFTRIPEGQTFAAKVYDRYERWNFNSENTNVFNIVNIDNIQIGPEMPGLEEMVKNGKKISEYFNPWMKCKIFAKSGANYVVIFVEDLDTRKIHNLMSLFPAYFPDLFKPGGVNNLTELEKQLCKSLASRSSDEFLKVIADIGEANGLQKDYVRNLLQNYMLNNIRAMLQNAQREKDRAQSRLDSNIEEYRELFKDLQVKIMRVEALQSKQIETDDELANYFMHNKHLRLQEVRGDTLCFYVMTELTWFDIEFYRHASANGSIYDVEYNRLFSNEEDRKLLMDAIFSEDPKFRVRMCSYYELSVSNDVSVHAGWTYPADILAKYIPNPHIQRHACLGGHREPIRNQIRNNNMIGAVEQCIASASSINLAERDATFNRFMKELFDNSNKILVDSDGKEYSAKEALKKLKEHK